MWHVWLQMSSKGGHETIQMCHLWQKLFSNRCHEQTCVNSSWGKEIHANVNYVANALLKSLKSTNIWHQFIKEIIKLILKFDQSSRILLEKTKSFGGEKRRKNFIFIYMLKVLIEVPLTIFLFCLPLIPLVLTLWLQQVSYFVYIFLIYVYKITPILNKVNT